MPFVLALILFLNYQFQDPSLNQGPMARSILSFVLASSLANMISWIYNGLYKNWKNKNIKLFFGFPIFLAFCYILFLLVIATDIYLYPENIILKTQLAIGPIWSACLWLIEAKERLALDNPDINDIEFKNA